MTNHPPTMTHVYFMPGMAASPLIFEHIELPKDQFTIHLMDWIMPLSKEPLTAYCERLLPQIIHKNPVLVGVSFGGMVVQELAALIGVAKVIIISSAKSEKEFPRRMRLSSKTGLHKWLPTRLIENFDTLANYSMGIAPKKIDLYKKYLNMNKSEYLDWALDTIVNWKQEHVLDNIVHIHGDADPIFPIKYIQNCIIVAGGTHVMIINRHRWFNENLPKIICQ